MESTIILDTDVLIDLLREKTETLNWIKEHEIADILATTTINVFEIFNEAYKCADSDKKLTLVESLIERLKILDFDSNSAKISGKQRALLEDQGLTLDVRDIFIGSIALSNNILLKTNNKKHFSRISKLRLV